MNKKIIRDIKEIILLAREAEFHIERNNIKKAKKEFNKIIKYDLKELKLAKKEHTGEKLIQEIIDVLHDAKEGFEDLKKCEYNFDTRSHINYEIKKLSDKIIKLEENEILEITREERIVNEFYFLWTHKIKTPYLYHGTNTASLPKIKEQGLEPNMRPYSMKDWKRFNKLFKKGTETSFHIDWEEGDEGPLSTVGAIHITKDKNEAIRYAKKGGSAVWTEAIVRWGLDNKNENENIFTLLGMLYETRFLSNKVLGKHTYEEHERLWKENEKKLRELYYYDRHKFNNLLRDFSHLSEKEIKELVCLFKKLGNTFKNVRPAIVYVQSDIPQILKLFHNFSIFTSFEEFSKYVEKLGNKSMYSLDKKVVAYVEEGIRGRTLDIKINKKIPPNFLKYEIL